MKSDEVPSRRDLLDLTARATSFATGAAFFSQWLKAGQSHHQRSASPPEPDLLGNYHPKFFAPEDFEALQSFTEILIPTDNDPGAHEAHCAHFIDFVLTASSEVPEAQTAWRHAMELLRATGFHQANATRRLEIVSEISKSEIDLQTKHPAFFAYRLIKEHTTFAFYTSRPGTIETLDYRGNSYNPVFPACNHPEHQLI